MLRPCLFAFFFSYSVGRGRRLRVVGLSPLLTPRSPLPPLSALKEALEDVAAAGGACGGIAAIPSASRHLLFMKDFLALPRVALLS